MIEQYNPAVFVSWRQVQAFSRLFLITKYPNFYLI